MTPECQQEVTPWFLVLPLVLMLWALALLLVSGALWCAGQLYIITLEWWRDHRHDRHFQAGFWLARERAVAVVSLWRGGGGADEHDALLLKLKRMEP